MRSLTVGLPIWSASHAQLTDGLKGLLQQASSLMAAHGLGTRTVRVTLPPVPEEIARQPGAVASAMTAVGQLASDSGARWYCLPVSLLDADDPSAMLGEVLNVLAKHPRLFVNLIIADDARISTRGARAAAELILNLSRRSPNGFDGFRVGISAACEPNTPFFPFSRHEGEQPAFSLALETTAAAIQALKASPHKRAPVSELRQALHPVLLQRVAKVDAFGRALESASGVRYAGLDASYAPFPDAESSVGALIECFGVSPVGANGTLFITSVLTDTLKAVLKESGARCAGFNGVMYSVLEDPKLVSSNNLSQLSLEKLMLFSTLCGCGIDMVPIPATTYLEDVTSMVLDVAALAIRLGKPLGVRFVPVPNKQVNEYVSFNLDFLCDSRVMNPGISDSMLRHDENEPWRYLSSPSRKAGG